jgi:hypothetical protein
MLVAWLLMTEPIIRLPYPFKWHYWPAFAYFAHHVCGRVQKNEGHSFYMHAFNVKRP